jgi:hypothetical protein
MTRGVGAFPSAESERVANSGKLFKSRIQQLSSERVRRLKKNPEASERDESTVAVGTRCVVRLSFLSLPASAGTVTFSTFVGGSDVDAVNAVATDPVD